MKKIYLIATIVAIIAGFATFLFINNMKPTTTVDGTQSVEVVVASQDIPAKTLITAEMLSVVVLPETAVTPGAATKTSDIVGLVTLYPLANGEQVLANKFVTVGTPASTGPLSYLLKSGEYAYTIYVDILTSIAGFARENDYVDIYHSSSMTEQDIGRVDANGRTLVAGDTKIDLLLENIEILKISNFASAVTKETTGTEITLYSEVTLRLTKEQVAKVTDALASGTLQLALVSYVDGAGLNDENSQEETQETEPITQEVATLPEETEES